MNSDKNKPPDPGIPEHDSESRDSESLGSPSFSTLTAPSIRSSSSSPIPDVELLPNEASSRKRGPIADDQSIRHKITRIENSTKSSKNNQPSTPAYTRKYLSSDLGPFAVHVSKIESDPSSGVSIHPVKFGQFIFKHNISHISKDGIKKLGRNRIVVEFTISSAANDFLENSLLLEKGYKAFIPSYQVTRMGIARGIPTDFSNEEIPNYIDVPLGCGKVVKARRLNYKVRNETSYEWRPSETVVLTFDGQRLPRYVYCFHNSIAIEPYKFPVIQCFNCCRYGHVKEACRSNSRCHKCGGPHSSNRCYINDDSLSCIFCSGTHSALDKNCPEQQRQREIKTRMSEEGISFQEAAKGIAASQRPYSEVLKQAHVTRVPTQDPINHIETNSYRKTVFLKPKPRAPIQRGYDKKAHENIIREFNIPTPENGCALQSSKTISNSTDVSKISDILDLLQQSLVTYVSTNQSLPSNVAEKLFEITQLLINQNGNHSTMEYQEHSS